MDKSISSFKSFFAILVLITFMVVRSVMAQTNTKIACSSDGRLLAVCQDNRQSTFQMRIYHVRTLQFLALMEVSTYCNVSSDRKMFFSLNAEKIMLKDYYNSYVLDIKDQKLDIIRNSNVNFSINEEQFLTTNNNILMIHNLETKERVAIFEVYEKIKEVIESPNSQAIAIITNKDRCYFGKRTNGRHKKSLKMFENVIDARFSTDSRLFHVLVCKKDRCFVNTYETATLKLVQTVQSQNFTAYSNIYGSSIYGSSFSPEGRYVLFRLDNNFEVHELATRRLVGIFSSIESANFTYDEKPRTWLTDSTLVFLEGKVRISKESGKREGHLYNIASDKIEELNLKTYFKKSLKSPDMRWLVSWDDKNTDPKKIQIALQSSSEKQHQLLDGIIPLGFSPDSELLFFEKIINGKNYYGFMFTKDFLNPQRKLYKFSDIPLSRAGEPSSREDATPPDNYKYYFSKTLKAYDPKLQSDVYAFVFKNLNVSEDKNADLSFNWVDTLGNFYTNMTTQAFRHHICEVNLIRENKQKIPVADWKVTEHHDAGPSCLVLVLDHSGSMGNERALVMQEGVKKLIDKKHPQDSIALIRYDHRVKVLAKPTADKDSLYSRNPLDGLKNFGGTTALLDATYRAVRGLSKENPHHKRAVLLITDGWENSSFVTETEVVNLALQHNIPIYTLAFGNSVDVDLLTYLAEATQGTFYQIYGTDFLLDIFDDIYTKMSYYYTLSFEVPSPNENYILQVKFCQKNLETFEVPLITSKKKVVEEFSLGETFDADEVISFKEGEKLQIYFGFNIDQIVQEDIKKIENVAAFLKKNPKIKIALHGHTDNVGGESYNIALSVRRANEVKRRLVRLGVEPTRIEIKGFGSSQPIASNQTEEGRAKNRRTEMVILKK